jgi:dihydrofolate reductase
MSRISLIAAIGKNRELGKGGELAWRIPDDLKRFKTLTTGHPIIMGRKTFDSIGKALPGRTNIVITRDETLQREGILKASSIESAIELAKRAKGSDEIFIIGGGEIYKQSLPFADRLCLTLIDASKDADAFFPEYENMFNKKTFEEKRTFNELSYTWVNLEK